MKETTSALSETRDAIRTCVGCGRKAPKVEFLRFVARESELVLGATDPGRGAYTCRRLACFERARARNAFNRTLKRTIRVDEKLHSLYT